MSIESNIKWAESKIAELEAEVADLRAYIRVERGKPSASATLGVGQGKTTTLAEALIAVLADSARHGRKKMAMLLSLAHSLNGLRTQEIVAAITSGGVEGSTVENTSPQLSAYKADGLIDLKDGVWTITTKGMNYLGEKEKGSAP